MGIRFTRRRKILLGTTVLVVGALAFVPVTPWVESQLVQTLEAQGFTNVKLRVAHLGLGGVALKEVSVGDTPPLKLENVSIAYSLGDLRAKRVSGITIEGLTLTGYKNDTSWGVGGLDALMQKPSGATASTIPVSRDALLSLPLSSVEVKNSHFALDTGGLALDIPLALRWNMTPVPTLHYEAPEWGIKASEIRVSTGEVLIDAALKEDAHTWQGNWSIAGITVTGAPMELPLLQAKGTLSAESTRVVLTGKLADARNSYHASFELTYDLKNAAKSALTVTNLRLPWNDGVVGADAARIPLGGNQGSRFTLAAERVSIAALMKSLTGEKATGTGVVSGTIPVSIAADGKVTLQQGNLHAEEPGIIAIAPETIPGDNKQVALVRDILKNLHYTLLSITLDSTPDNKLVVKMAVEGKNPDVSGGRPVRLNVQLNGDVLNLIQQNMMAVTDPTKLLEQRK